MYSVNKLFIIITLKKAKIYTTGGQWDGKEEGGVGGWEEEGQGRRMRKRKAGLRDYMKEVR